MIRLSIPALLLVAALVPRAASGADDCLERGYLARFNPTLTTPQPCDPIHSADIHWRGHTAHLRALKLRGVPMTTSPVFAARVDEIAANVGRALDRMGGDFPSFHGITITILFTNFVSPRERTSDEGELDKGDFTAGAGTPYGADCPVTYYKDRLRSTGEDFVFVTSHEIFHCVQYVTWPSMPEQQWLTEASAEYFALLATPGYTGSTTLITNFDNQIPGTSLSRMSYEAVVFYLWLGQTSGPPRVLELVGTARTIESAIPPDLWMQFVTSYLDTTIRFPDGRAIPSRPFLSGPMPVAGSTRFELSRAIPYTAQNFDFVFERGHSFHLVYTGQPSDFRSRWRRAEGGAWEAPLTDVSTCDGPHTYRVAWATTTSTSAGGITITATDSAVGDSLCSMLGGWAMTRPSLENAIRAFEQGNTCTVQSGTIRLIFTGAPGTTSAGVRGIGPRGGGPRGGGPRGGGPALGAYAGSYVFDALTYRCERPASAGGGWTKTTITGTAAMNWRTADPYLTIAFVRPATPFGTVHREIHTPKPHVPNARGEDGVRLPITKDEPLVGPFMGPFFGGPYTMSGGRLHIGAPPGMSPGDYSFDFAR